MTPQTQAIASEPLAVPVARRERPERPPTAPGIPERPALASGVRLVGQMSGTGFVEDPWLIERDGRFVQVSELIFRVAEHADGTRTLEQIAEDVTRATDWIVTADLIRHLIRSKLAPLGLVAGEGTAPGPRTSPWVSPLAVSLRLRMIGPRAIDPVTGLLRWLFAPPIVVAVLAALAFAEGLLFLVHDIGAGIRAALFTPGFLPLAMLALLAGNVFHEFGHAAALRYGGGKVRGMGVGIYLFFPMLYTDVTDSYRLGRRARLRTDLGGVYFHLIFALAVMGLFWVTGQEALLFIVLLVNAQVIGQFLPFARFDGYWILADMTGVPDFFSQMGPFVRSALPSARRRGSRLPVLKPWVRVVFAVYTFVTVPLLAFFLVLMVKGLPAFVVTAWDALLYQRTVFAEALSDGASMVLVGTALQALFLIVQLVGVAFILYGVAQIPFRLIRSWQGPRRLPRLAPVL